MMDTRWQSPLAHRAPIAVEPAIALREVPFVTYFVLRGDASALGAGVLAACGLELPRAVGGTASTDEISLMWLGPDEWVLSGTTEQSSAVISRLEDALASVPHQLVDVSDQNTTIAVSGIRARDLLSKLMIIDLHPSALKAGDGIATLLAKSHIWLRLIRDEAGQAHFLITVRRSFADYVWCLLAEAGREWELPEQAPAAAVRLHLPHVRG